MTETYYSKNRDKVLARQKERREADPERSREIVRRSYWKHIESNRPLKKAASEKFRSKHLTDAQIDAKRRRRELWFSDLEGNRERARNAARVRARERANARLNGRPPNTGKCWACGIAEEWRQHTQRGRSVSKSNLGIDHCHETNVNRGWLCTPCNLMEWYFAKRKLGPMATLPEHLRVYLEKYGAGWNP